MKKKVLAVILAATMVLGLAACGSKPAAETAKTEEAAPAKEETKTEEAAPAAESSGELIKVGIINNDPNESGYRTANDKDLKEMFT